MTIDQTIERELLGGRVVSIPFVGTLGIEILSAHFVEGVGSPIIPPRGMLTINADYIDQRSIIFIYAHQSCNSDIDQATLLYNEWLTQSSNASGWMTIGGVCSIDLSQFTIITDQRFEVLLSPAGVLPVSIGRTAPALASTKVERKVRRSNVPVTIALLVVIFAAIYIVYYLWF